MVNPSLVKSTHIENSLTRPDGPNGGKEDYVGADITARRQVILARIDTEGGDHE